MKPIILIGIIAGVLVLGGCSLNTKPNTPPPSETPPLSSVSVPTEAATIDGTAMLAIASDTGPYINQTALLDGICFEYLFQLAPTHWRWDSMDDLLAFFESADNSGLCAMPAPRPAFVFDDQVLVGVVRSARGCDAAQRVSAALSPSQVKPELILRVSLIVQPGCEYDLLEPLLIAVPRPRDGTTIIVVLEPAP